MRGWVLCTTRTRVVEPLDRGGAVRCGFDSSIDLGRMDAAALGLLSRVPTVIFRATGFDVVFFFAFGVVLAFILAFVLIFVVAFAFVFFLVLVFFAILVTILYAIFSAIYC
jgi:hypothetical protein